MSTVTGEQLRTLFASPVSVKTTVVATTSPETNYSQSHQMEIFNRSGLEINFGECEDGSAGVKQATVTSHLSAFNYNDKNEQASACAGNDLTQSVIPLKDTSEDDDAGEELKGSFATPFLVSQSIGEGPGTIGKENLSESVNDLIENQQEEQLRNSFASPVSVKAPVEEAISTCQLKTAMIAIASEMVGKEHMCKGFEISGEPLTVEIISGDSYSTKRACFLKENEEQCKRGPLFATPAKGKSPMQYAESPDCQLMEAETALSTEGIDSKATNKDQGSPLVTKEAKESCEPSKERDELEHIGGSFQCIKEFNFPKEEDYTEWSQPFASSDVDSQALDHCPGSANEVFTASKSSKYGKEREIIYEGKTPASDEVKYGDNYVGSVEDIFKDLDGDKFLNSEEQVFAHYEDCQLLREMTDDTGEATLHWFQTNDGGVPRQIELETQNENDSVLQLEPFQEKGEVTEDAPAEGETDDHQLTSQESLEDRSLNIKEAAKGGSVSDTVCLQPNVLLTDFETKNINEQSNQGHDSIENIDGISLSAESEFVAFDAESTTLRSQEIIIIAQEYKGDEVQKLEVRKMSNANIPNSGESAKEISIVLTADKQLHFPEHHHVIDNVASTGEFTASENECQDFCKEFDVAAMRDSDSRQSSLATQQDEYSFDKKKHEAIESVISPSSKFCVKNSFSEEGFAGGDTLMSRKISGLAKKKGPSTPAGVAKTSFAKHLNTTVKKNNARTILIHGTPNKLSHKADMKENAASVKGESIGTLTTLRPEKRRVLTMLPWK